MILVDKLILAAADVYWKLTRRRLVRRYRRNNHRTPNIAFPTRYSERMLWRKIVDRNPLLVTFSDKLAAKDYVQKICPDLPVPKTLWVGTDANNIPAELLERDVFIKANHGCNFNFRNLPPLRSRDELVRLTARWLQTSFGRPDDIGQWAYDEVERKLFVEETIGLQDRPLLEFNVRASNGRALLGSVMGQVKTAEQWHFYLDTQGRATWGMSDEAGDAIKPLPPTLDIIAPYLQAVRFAERLSRGVDFARFDFMWDGEKLFGGEITVFPAAGDTDPFHPHVINLMDNGWDFSPTHLLTAPQHGWKKIYAEALRRQLNKQSRF